MGEISVNPSSVAVVVGAQTVLLAVVTGAFAWLSARQAAKTKSQEKAEDYARQDAVAARVAVAAQQAADAATLLLKAQADTIARTDEVARLAEASNTRITAQLVAIDKQGEKIHGLVNSDMTAARTAERDSLRLLVIALKRVGQPEDAEEITRVEARIEELNQILADRLAAQQRVDAVAAREKAKPR